MLHDSGSHETPNPEREYDGGHMGKGRIGPEHGQEGLKSEGSASAYQGSENRES